jgi:hypothetical protein
MMKAITRRATGGSDLLASIRDVVRQSRKTVAYGVNTAMVLTNYEIGRLIVEHEQKGAVRAEYAEKTLKMLAHRLTTEFGKGYSKSNLEYMRKFYLLFGKTQTLSGQSDKQTDLAPMPPSGAAISATASRKSVTPFRLSWSHYVFLMTITDEAEQQFARRPGTLFRGLVTITMGEVADAI